MEPTKSQLIYKNACLSEGIEKLQIENEELRVQNEALCLKVKHIKEVMGDLTSYYKEKLAESEKSKELYRIQDNDHYSKLWQFYSRLGVEAFGADIHEKALEELGKLKQQLAEKDKAIENYEKFTSVPLVEMTKMYEQDKIDFAVEQINELKNMLADRAELIDCEQVAEFMFTVYDLEMCSKQLITEIKEGK